jgi:group I intron endonuclease
MYCYYIIVGIVTHSCYVGSTQDLEKRMKRHIRDANKGVHHNPKLSELLLNEEYEVGSISCSSREEAYEREGIMIRKMIESEYTVLNIAVNSRAGDCLTRHPDRENIIKRREKTKKDNFNALNNDEKEIVKKKRSMQNSGENNPMYGRKHTKVSRTKMSDNSIRLFGKDNPAYGRKATLANRILLSKLASERIGNKNPFFGRKHSDETKEKLSKAATGRAQLTLRKKISIYGVIYESLTNAGIKLKTNPSTLLHRARSKNPKYSDIFYI